MYFVIQKKHNFTNNAWDNGVINKDTEYDAIHQFHAFMSTYAYGYNANLDYVSCSVEQDDGRTIKAEIDDRRWLTAQQQQQEELGE